MRSLRIELANGIVMPYLEQGDGQGVPVVLLHAVADSLRAFEPMLPHLSDAIHAFVPSQRGHGNASRPASGYRVEDFTDDLSMFMDALGIAAAVVVGGSSGGLAARRFAIDHPKRTLGLAMLGCPLALGDKPRAREMWESTFSKLVDPIDPEMVREFAEATMAPSVPKEFVEILIAESLKPPAHVWVQTMAGILEDRSHEELGAIDAPTLIVYGAEDTLLSREDQEAMTARIPNARFVAYPGLGHTFYWEDPARTAAELATFVEGLAT